MFLELQFGIDAKYENINEVAIEMVAINVKTKFVFTVNQWNGLDFTGNMQRPVHA